MSRPIRAAIWDVDGTLVDTAEHHFRAWETFATEIDQPFSRDDFAATFGMRNPEILRKLFDPQASDEQCAEWGERKETIYREAVRRDGTQLLPGVRSLLEALAAAGWQQAVGSSAPTGNLELLLEVTGTRPFFQAIVSGDDVSKGKPDPEVFLIAARRLGAKPADCVVLEDAAAGVEAARNGGMKCVAVTFVGHHPPERLRVAGADVIVETLEQITLKQIEEL